MNTTATAVMACLFFLASETVARAVTPAAEQASSPSDAAKWLGRWTGVASRSEGSFHVETPFDIEIRSAPTGLEFVDNDRQRGGKAPGAMTVNGSAFTCEYYGLWPTPITVTGLLAADGATLDLAMSGDGMTGTESHRVTLRHDDPAARKFLAPRVSAAGTPDRVCHHIAPVAVADGIAVSAPRTVGIDLAPLEALLQSVCAESGRLVEPQTESILISRHGKLVFEEYFWGQSADNPHIISSSTKSVTSIIAGIAVDHERLATDARIASYFPDRRDSLWVRDKYPISVRNVLSMSSGTAWDDRIQGAENPSAQLLLTNDVVGYMLGKPSLHPAGTVYVYDNGLPSLMGALIARTTGEPFDHFAAENLLTPMGISNYRWTRMRDGTVLAAGGFYLRSRDMAKIGQMMLNHGRWQNRQIVSSAWVAESTRQQSAPDQYPYGFYWHLTNAQHRHVKGVDGFMALGQGGQIIAVFPSLDLVVVTTAQNWQVPSLEAMPFGLFDEFILPAVSH